MVPVIINATVTFMVFKIAISRLKINGHDNGITLKAYAFFTCLVFSSYSLYA